MVMHLPSAASATAVAATPMSATSVAAEAATPCETMPTIHREPVPADRCEAVSDMLPEIVAIVPVAKISDMVEEAGAAKAEVERTINRVVRAFGIPVVGAGIVV